MADTTDTPPQQGDPTNPITGEQIARRVAALKAQGAPDEAIHAYLTSVGATVGTGNKWHDLFQSGQLAPMMAGRNARDAANLADETNTPSYWQQALGGISALGGGVGSAGERLQAYAREGASRIPGLSTLMGGPETYEQALSNIQQGKQSSGAVGKANALLGTGVQAAALPGVLGAGAGALGAAGEAAGAAGVAAKATQAAQAALRSAALSPVMQGGIFGGIQGGFGSNPADLTTHVENAAGDAALSALAGNVLGRAGTTVRKWFAPSLGTVSNDAADAITASDGLKYAAAKAEAAGRGSTPELRAMMQNDYVKPYIDLARTDASLRGATDAELVMKARQLMSEDALAITQSKAAKMGTYKASNAIDLANINAAKQAVKEGVSAPSVVPGRANVFPERMGTTQGPATGEALSATTQAPSDPTLRQALRDFPGSSLPPEMQGPGGPQFQLRGVAESAVPVTPSRVIPPAIPSLPGAVAAHAQLSGEAGQIASAYDAAQRIIDATKLKGDEGTALSPETFMNSIRGTPARTLTRTVQGVSTELPVEARPPMKPDAARLARQGVMAALKQSPALNLSLRGLVSSSPATRIAPYLQALDQSANQGTFQQGLSALDLIRSLGVGAASGNDQGPLQRP